MTERIGRLAALVPFGLLGLLASAAAQECKTTHEVEITFQGARGFKPRELHVHVGDCVRWVNGTHIEHSAVALDRSFHTGTLMPGRAEGPPRPADRGRALLPAPRLAPPDRPRRTPGASAGPRTLARPLIAPLPPPGTRAARRRPRRMARRPVARARTPAHERQPP